MFPVGILSGKVRAVVNKVTTVLNPQLCPASKHRQKRPHFLQELQLERKSLIWMLEIAASAAKLAVYQAAPECSNKSCTPSDGMNSYLQRKEAQNGLNSAAKLFQSCTLRTLPQNFTIPERNLSTLNTHVAVQYGDYGDGIS